AAPRLVAAVLEEGEGSRVARTYAMVDHRPREKEGGDHFFGLGLMGLAVPGTDLYAGAGFILRWTFETPDFGVVSDFRFGGGSPGEDTASKRAPRSSATTNRG